MAAKVSAQALQLVQARDGKEFIPIEDLFSPGERKVLLRMNAKLSKEGTAVHNPHDPTSLAYASWIIGRLGGWSGYQAQRPPGPIRIHRGLQRFYETAQWLIETNDV